MSDMFVDNVDGPFSFIVVHRGASGPHNLIPEYPTALHGEAASPVEFIWDPFGGHVPWDLPRVFEFVQCRILIAYAIISLKLYGTYPFQWLTLTIGFDLSYGCNRSLDSRLDGMAVLTAVWTVVLTEVRSVVMTFPLLLFSAGRRVCSGDSLGDGPQEIRGGCVSDTVHPGLLIRTIPQPAWAKTFLFEALCRMSELSVRCHVFLLCSSSCVVLVSLRAQKPRKASGGRRALRAGPRNKKRKKIVLFLNVGFM